MGKTDEKYLTLRDVLLMLEKDYEAPEGLWERIQRIIRKQ